VVGLKSIRVIAEQAALAFPKDQQQTVSSIKAEH
jgi:hypothetical protein